MNIFKAAGIPLMCEICGEDIDLAHSDLETPICDSKSCHEEYKRKNKGEEK